MLLKRSLSGKEIWRFSPGKKDSRLIGNDGGLVTLWPIRTDVAVADGKVYFAASLVPWVEPYLCAVEATTGAVDSATSQFFINLNSNDFLNHGGRDFGYAVFGRVSDGMDVVEAIAGVATGNKGGHQDVPLDTVTITEVTITE